MSLKEKMREHILNAGIKEKELDKLFSEEYEKHIIDHINENMEKVLNQEWAKVQEIWTKPNINPEMWENYKLLFNKPVLPEHKMLVKAQAELRFIIRKILKEVRDETKRLQKERTGRKDKETVDPVPKE